MNPPGVNECYMWSPASLLELGGHRTGPFLAIYYRQTLENDLTLHFSPDSLKQTPHPDGNH